MNLNTLPPLSVRVSPVSLIRLVGGVVLSRLCRSLIRRNLSLPFYFCEFSWV